MNSQRPQNWVFLGDSLTEGVGSSRSSYVQELAALMRERSRKLTIKEIRLRYDSCATTEDPKPFNLLGHQSPVDMVEIDIWIWNLASEGTTIEHDKLWLPLMQNLKPEKVFLLRGGLESIVRPNSNITGGFPWWVPKGWRGYASLDPRCYFSTTWWRRLKQEAVDSLKQKLRRSLLQREATGYLLTDSVFDLHLEELCIQIKSLGSELIGIGLPPVSNKTFPGSQSRFDRINFLLLQAMNRHSGNYVDLSNAFGNEGADSDFYYRDGFHQTKKGSTVIARILLNFVFHKDLSPPTP